MGKGPTPQLQNMLQLLQKNEEEYKLIGKLLEIAIIGTAAVATGGLALALLSSGGEDKEWTP